MRQHSYDVIVAGVGAMGSAACRHSPGGVPGLGRLDHADLSTTRLST